MNTVIVIKKIFSASKLVRIIFKLSVYLLILVSLIQFNFKIQTLALSLDQVNLDFTSSESKNYLEGDKLIQTKQALIRKINTENLSDRDFQVTNVSQQNNFSIVSLANLLPTDLIHGDHSGFPIVNKKVLYFNIFIFQNNGLFLAKLDTEKLDNNFSSQSNINNQGKNLLNSLYKGPKGNFTTQSTNRYPNYKLPWKGGEAWITEMVFNNKPWAWHMDHVGPALDFLPPQGSSLQMFASSSGVVEWICTTDNARNQSGIHIRTIDGGVDYRESLRYYHIRKDMLAVGYQFVSQGQYLGQIKEGGNTGMVGCNLYSFNTHPHFGFPAKNFVMQGVIFDTALSQSNCLLYSTQNMPNVGIKNNYQLIKSFSDYDSGPCKSKPLIVYNPNNAALNFQLRINGQISTDTMTIPPKQNLKIPLEGMYGNLEIYTENAKELTITFLNTSSFGTNYKPRPVGKTNSDMSNSHDLENNTPEQEPPSSNNPSNYSTVEVSNLTDQKLIQESVNETSTNEGLQLGLVAYQNKSISPKPFEYFNQNLVLGLTLIPIATLTLTALYFKKRKNQN